VDGTAEQTLVERELHIEASPETVWEFLVDPEKIVRWKGQSAVFDARNGGSHRVEVLPGHVASGEVVELDPPRRLVYTWGWQPGDDGPNPVPPGSSTIEIVLAPAAGGTMLRFTHRHLPSPEAAESHAAGWDHYLPRLAIAASGGNAGRDPWLDGQT
jgi:uncharacterized protein YndB with AHSA1/START domain